MFYLPQQYHSLKKCNEDAAKITAHYDLIYDPDKQYLVDGKHLVDAYCL